jgi:hypothetical protein
MNDIIRQGDEMSKDKDQELEILLHTLGLDNDKVIEPYRNYFVASDDHSDLPTILRLIDLGFMQENRAPVFLKDGDRVFCVTEIGKFFAIKNRPRPPKRTRSQKRYDAFVNIADVYPDLTFREFLTHPHFEKARRGMVR